jgi:hypothetical protein
MRRSERNFLAREGVEQKWILENTWCDTCSKADLGMTSPQEYEEDGRIYVEGNCRICGRQVRSEITEMGTS